MNKSNNSAVTQICYTQTMEDITNGTLISKAASVINDRKIDDFNHVGQVGAAILTATGNVYTGVCIDAGSGMGFCAEASAVAAMVTAGETKIEKIVATWKDRDTVYVVSPCGRCRQFIACIDAGNTDTEVILSSTDSVPLKDLLPHPNEYNKM